MDVARLRRDFPLLDRDDPPVYLDSACMSLKPRPVLRAMQEYYEEYPACGDRSPHRLANRVTMYVREARQTCARFVRLADPARMVFTRNTTESISLVRHGLGLEAGDSVVTTDKEHNSNLVPWLDARNRQGVHLEIVATRPDGTLELEAWKEGVARAKAAGRLRLAAIGHASNVDGWTMPLREMAGVASDAGALVLADAAQSVPHAPVAFDRLDVDFLAWSFHKMLGPTGMGGLAMSQRAVEALHPVHLGGDTVETVSNEGFRLLPSPERFEGGLQDYAGILGAAAACRYLSDVGLEEVTAHGKRLNEVLSEGLVSVPGVAVHGPADPASRGGIVPFTVEGLSGHDVALYLDEAGRILLRSGTHCAHTFFGGHGEPEGWVRASLYLYNTEAECRLVVEKLEALTGRLAAARAKGA